MSKNMSAFKKYIEILLLIIITVGPFSPVVKMMMYFVLLLMNIHFIGALQEIKPLFFVLLCSMIIPMILDIRNIDASTPYSLAGFMFFSPFLFCMIFICDFEKKEFLNLLEKVILFVSVFSLFGYIIQVFVPSVIERFPVTVYYGRKVNTIGLFGAIRNYTGIHFLNRNCGIAFEPGAFQFLPNLGIALLFGDKKRERNWKYWVRVVIYAITVLTTYSTAGFVVLALLVVVGSVSNRKQFFIMMIVIALLGGMLLSSYQYQIQKMETGNFTERFERTLYVIKNYSRNIFGIGSTGYDKIYAYNKMIGSWDIYTNLYLRFGLVFTCILIYLCIHLGKINIYICLTVILSFMSESLLGPIVVMLMYYSFQTIDNNVNLNTE